MAVASWFCFQFNKLLFSKQLRTPLLVVERIKIDPLVWKQIFLDPFEKSSEQKRDFRVLRVAWARRRRRFLVWSGIQEPTNQYFLIYFPKVVSKLEKLAFLWPMASRGKAVLAKMAPGIKT